MRNKTLATGLLLVTLSSACLADEEKDIYAITPENCDELTLEKCTEVMTWAKQQIAESKERTQTHKDNIACMHEQALELLNQDTKQRNNRRAGLCGSVTFWEERIDPTNDHASRRFPARPKGQRHYKKKACHSKLGFFPESYRC